LMREEEEKAKIQKEISMLTDRLSKLNESLARKQRAKEEYDRTIAESEGAYMKILDSSDALLQVLKKERDTLSKKKTGV
jgi:Sjoegren syndrome nuclear autoantigen 1